MKKRGTRVAASLLTDAQKRGKSARAQHKLVSSNGGREVVHAPLAVHRKGEKDPLGPVA